MYRQKTRRCGCGPLSSGPGSAKEMLPRKCSCWPRIRPRRYWVMSDLPGVPVHDGDGLTGKSPRIFFRWRGVLGAGIGQAFCGRDGNVRRTGCTGSRQGRTLCTRAITVVGWRPPYTVRGADKRCRALTWRWCTASAETTAHPAAHRQYPPAAATRCQPPLPVGSIPERCCGRCCHCAPPAGCLSPLAQP